MESARRSTGCRAAGRSGAAAPRRAALFSPKYWPVRIYFSTVIRSAPTLQGGEIVRLQWETKRIEARAPVAATDPVLNDPNPRGNTRGGRGIVRYGDEILVCSYHTVKAFDPALRPVRDLGHPLMVGLHEVSATTRGSLLVTCTATDAVLEIDLETGGCLRSWWPREQPGTPHLSSGSRMSECLRLSVQC